MEEPFPSGDGRTPLHFGALTVTKLAELAGVSVQHVQDLVKITQTSLVILLLASVIRLPMILRISLIRPDKLILRKIE
jgi:hypothetical protein